MFMGYRKIRKQIKGMAEAWDKRFDAQRAEIVKFRKEFDSAVTAGHVRSQVQDVHTERIVKLEGSVVDLYAVKADKPKAWTPAQRAKFRSDAAKRGVATRKANAAKKAAEAKRRAKR